MLGDKDGRFLVLELGQDFRCLTFERGDEFGAHGVILKWHSLTIKLRRAGLLNTPRLKASLSTEPDAPRCIWAHNMTPYGSSLILM